MRDLEEFLDDVDDVLDDDSWEWGPDAAHWFPVSESNPAAAYAELQETALASWRAAFDVMLSELARRTLIPEVMWRQPDLPTRAARQEAVERIQREVGDRAGYTPSWIVVDETHDWSDEMMRRAHVAAEEMRDSRARYSFPVRMSEVLRG